CSCLGARGPYSSAPSARNTGMLATMPVPFRELLPQLRFSYLSLSGRLLPMPVAQLPAIRDKKLHPPGTKRVVSAFQIVRSQGLLYGFPTARFAAMSSAPPVPATRPRRSIRDVISPLLLHALLSGLADAVRRNDGSAVERYKRRIRSLTQEHFVTNLSLSEYPESDSVGQYPIHNIKPGMFSPETGHRLVARLDT